MARSYHIFALPVTESNLIYAKKQQYSRISPDVILIYTDKKRPKGERISCEMLSPQDAVWIMECNDQIVKKLLKSNEETGINMMQFLDALERELQEEQRKGEPINGKY